MCLRATATLDVEDAIREYLEWEIDPVNATVRSGFLLSEVCLINPRLPSCHRGPRLVGVRFDDCRYSAAHICCNVRSDKEDS